MGRTHQQGTAIVGGDVSGDARGANSIDIQTTRAGVAEVASDANSIAIGQENTASGLYGYQVAIGGKNTVSTYGWSLAIGYINTASHYFNTAVGYSNSASNRYAVAVGYDNDASGNASVAAGYRCSASAQYTTALGIHAEARITKTTNICGPQINRKDDGESAANAFERFSGAKVVLMTKEVDLKVVADHTLSLPASCKFWFDEIGLIATDIDTLTVQPTIRFGITGTPAKQNAAAITTAITAAGKGEIEVPLVPEDGETSLVGGITVAATATTAKGRFYFCGLLVEDE